MRKERPQRGGALVEPTCVPQITEPEQLKIEMVAELVTQGAQKRAEACHFLTGRPHPQPDEHGSGVVVPEQFRRPVLADFQWSGGEDTDAAFRDTIEV
jgi:hypothetical protein